MGIYLFINDHARGPYTEGEVKDMLAHREVFARTPARREGENTWSAVEACLAPEAALAGAGAKSPIPARFVKPVALDPPPAQVTPKDENIYFSHARYTLRRVREDHQKDYRSPANQPGIGRTLSLLVTSGLLFGAFFVRMAMGADVMAMFFYIAAAVALTVVTILRLMNLGFSLWWCLLLFVPFVNIYVGIACLAAPPGYAYAKKFDTTGKAILWSLGFVFFLSVAVIVSAILWVPDFKTEVFKLME